MLTPHDNHPYERLILKCQNKLIAAPVCVFRLGTLINTNFFFFVRLLPFGLKATVAKLMTVHVTRGGELRHWSQMIINIHRDSENSSPLGPCYSATRAELHSPSFPASPEALISVCS